MPLARFFLQAIQKGLRLIWRLGPGETAGGEVLFGAADAGLYLRVIKPELIVGYEGRRHELIGPAVRTLQEEEIACSHAQL